MLIIPKISLSKNTHGKSGYNLRKNPLIKNIKKEDSKELTEKSYQKKKFEIKKIKILYRPLHPKKRFNSSSMGINEIIKKENLPLIMNTSIKNMIIKFREEREKEILEKKFFYRDKSYEDIKKEKENNFLMLRAMLRRDPLTIQSLIKRNREEEKKIKKSESMKSLYLHYKKKSLNKSSILSRENLTGDNSIKEHKLSNSVIKESTNISKKNLWKKDFFQKISTVKPTYSMKKNETKIRSAFSLVLGGRLSPIKISNSPPKKFYQDCCFCFTNFISEKLGEISIFGIIDGNGNHGKIIAQNFKNYLINYFKIGNDMKVTLKKDNFYSIMYNSFINGQNYLIENSNKLNINLNYSGATGIVVLYPHNNTNKVYCANTGRNKCILYSMKGSIKLSYELYPSRASEKYRISVFKEQKKKEEEEQLKLNMENNNSENNNNSNNNNNMKKNEINNILKQNKVLIKIKEKEEFLNEFNELDISRCIGNLSAEDQGIIPGPEIGESDVRLNKGKFIVMGTESLWKYLTEEEVGEIVNGYYSSYDSEGACNELQDLAKDRWKEKNSGGFDDISVIVIFFDSKNL